MFDVSDRWSEPPDWEQMRLSRPGVAISTVNGIRQVLLSGNLAEAAGEVAPHSGEGWKRGAEGSAYRIRIARDRALLVGLTIDALGVGESRWSSREFAATDVSPGMIVFSVEGAGLLKILSSGIDVSLCLSSHARARSSRMLFAGLPVIAYLDQDEVAARVHVEASRATALWTWFAAVLERQGA